MKRYRSGIAGLPPHINDYSFMVWGLLNLYETTFNLIYLSRAIELTEIMIQDFADRKWWFFHWRKKCREVNSA